MSVNKNITILILLTISINTMYGQSLNKIVKKIAVINQVQYEGQAGKYENFQNYELLKEKTDTVQLLKLTDNINPVVATYASFGLIDKSFHDITPIYLKFLESDKYVSTLSGCLENDEKMSNELYHYYWNNVDEKLHKTDKTLLKLDSITLYNKNSDWLLILRALENRIYPKSFNSQIEFLAFEKTNYDAIFYLSNWYKAEYNDKIKVALVKYLVNTDFENVGIDYYYKTIEELFKFRDPEINEQIILKLKNDKFWKMVPERFNSLLQENGIYENFE